MLSNRINRLAPPPRSVPFTVICSAMFGITGVLGAIFLISGLCFTIVFTQGYRPIDDVRIAVSQTTSQGVVTDVTQTNSTENDVWVYQYDFAFTAKNGKHVTGRSYSTGERWSVGDRVTIEYVPEEPSIARIKGARSSLFAPWVLFVLVFPAVGAGMFGWTAFSGLRQVRLLRYGEVADARILGRRPTNVEVNGAPVMAYSYEIRTKTGETFNGTAKSLPKEQIGDEESEPALYLPSNPGRSTLVDAIALSHPLDVDDLSGQWISYEGKTKAAMYILIWVLAIALAGYEVLRTLGILL
jgi:Protein of unknown function (DUF3592)